MASTGEARAGRARLWPSAAAGATLAILVVLGAAAGVASLLDPGRLIANIFFGHDLWAGGAIAVAVITAWLVCARAPALPLLSPARTAAAVVGLAAVIAVIGWYAVMGDYPLSMDEFMARFDAGIFREGRLFATIPVEWRFLRGALQPQFTLFAPDGASWTSSYLPVNAMALAAAGRLGSPALAGAVWILLAGAAVYDIARRLWPQRPDAAAVAAVVLATSTQVLLAGMTAYAMPAHLALNLVWLALVLRDRWRTHALAALVAFAACGLHQVVFHPLFAAPFVLQVLVERRWRPAVFHILAYAAIGLFWLSYWRVVLPHGMAGAAAGGGASGLDIWLTRLHVVLANFNAPGVGLMAKNLFRFVVWQNPAGLGLAALGVYPAVRYGGPLRYAVLGVVLGIAAMTVMMPYQGHGWGYRYLHGQIGSLALLAALAWVRLGERLTPERLRAATTGFVALTVFSLACLLPLRAWQASELIAPYRRALAAIRAADADVVVVDTTGLMFGNDLVRNDPFLRNAPRIVDLVMLREPQIGPLCAGRRVVMFDQASGSGIRGARYARRSLERMAQNRRAMAALGCGTERIVLRR